MILSYAARLIPQRNDLRNADRDAIRISQKMGGRKIMDAGSNRY
jgi:hypothetical protein